MWGGKGGSFKDKFHPRLFTDGNFLLSRVENALLVTRHIRWRVSVGEETFHRGIEDGKKKKRTTTMVETRIQREKGGEGSLNQAVKSFPAGKGEDKGQRK